MIIKEDVFPCAVAIAMPDHPTQIQELRSIPTTPGAMRVGEAKVIVTDTRVIIVVDSAGGSEPLIKFSQEIEPGSHKRFTGNTDSYVVTKSGIKVAWRKDMNCGCGSRLKTWNPFRHVGSIKDPTE